MDVFVVGAGAHGRVVLDILRASRTWSSVQFADDNDKLWGETINGAPVVELEEALSRPHGAVGFVVSLGRPAIRLELCRRVQAHGHPLVNAVHPAAVVEPTATVGTGNMISAMAVVNSNARVGNSVVVNTSVVIEHDCIVEDGVSISSTASLAGRATVARGAFLCVGVRVLPRVRVGAGAVVGAGAIVADDIPDGMLAVGYPARAIKRVDESFDWSKVL